MSTRRPDDRTAAPSVAASSSADAEWLLTDGAGGFACGAVDGVPRRRYHGLWIARPPEQARRMAVVSAVDERVLLDGRTTFLLRAHWADQPEPARPAADVDFVPTPLPTWVTTGDGFVLERSVALRRSAADRPPVCLLRWRNHGRATIRLHVRPLLGWCDADHLPPADERFDGAVQARGASWGVRPDPRLPTLWLTADGVAAFVAEPAWYRRFLYATDRDRGYDHVGDRWTPGVVEFELGPGRDATLACALAEPCAEPAAAFDEALAAAHASDRLAATARDRFSGRLARGADDFLYRADGGRLGVLAGFPWFGEWGRDVFVALPGLTLARGRRDLCAEVLRGALPFLRRGLLPNVYGATPADSHYDSCDAALWFALAVQRFADAGGDAELVARELLPALAAIARAYEEGTELGLAVASDGLLRAGRADLNATWMDARTKDGPVTPRQGLPVEIQALWHALLAFLAERDPATWQAASDRCGKAFVGAFWLPDGKRLADRVHDGVADASVRPNMLVAAALPRSPMSAAQRAGCVAAAEAELLVPDGLRSLSPREGASRGRYDGDQERRDRAYHQGTAWPWLAGFYVEAALRAAPRAHKRTAAKLRAWLDGVAPELDRAGLGHVSEVFDGDAPHRPGGTFAQAWNTGELLRALALVAEAQA
ncbi:MAG: amylo-alpha-1,6-glucosidase [Planctomycetota bacterium]